MIRLDFDADAVPTALRSLPHCVCWRVADRDGKPTKIPVNPRTGGNAQTNNPSTWSTFDRAAAAARANGWGIGFVFDEDNPFSGVDLDGCRNPQTGAIAPWAHGILAALDSYAETSPSGCGVKIFLEGKITGGKGRRRGPVEVYSRERFFTLTGGHLSDTPSQIQPRQAALDALMARLFPSQEAPPRRVPGALSLADDEVLRRARGARNGDRFTQLWDGNWRARYGSASEADLALCSLLSFWCGGEPARVDALFRRSGLCREKWLARADYRAWTLDKATQGNVYDARRVA